jgi:hypothetical protein
MKKLFLISIPLICAIFFIVSVQAAKSDPVYGYDTAPLMRPVNDSAYIDISEYRKPDITLEKREKTKSLTDFEDFLRNTRNVYFTIWLFRIVQVNMMDINRKEQQIIINPLTWWKNFFNFQNNDSKRGDLEWEDGDRFKTNWVAHPIFGAYSYLYYRAKGYNRWTAAFGSLVQSTLFEYTIEGVIQSPSVHDLVITPGIGVPVGMVLEETSDWLETRDNGFLHAMGYVVNPLKIIVPDRDDVNLSPLVSGQVVIGFQW